MWCNQRLKPASLNYHNPSLNSLPHPMSYVANKPIEYVHLLQPKADLARASHGQQASQHRAWLEHSHLYTRRREQQQLPTQCTTPQVSEMSPFGVWAHTIGLFLP